MNLYKPRSYTDAAHEEISENTNGCGAKGLGGWFVPDTLYGLNICDACEIHDWMYFKGKTAEDKNEADRAFLNNMVRIIDDKSGWLLKGVRKIRAKNYYRAVKYFGGPSFWAGK